MEKLTGTRLMFHLSRGPTTPLTPVVFRSGIQRGPSNGRWVCIPRRKIGHQANSPRFVEFLANCMGVLSYWMPVNQHPYGRAMVYSPVHSTPNTRWMDYPITPTTKFIRMTTIGG